MEWGLYFVNMYKMDDSYARMLKQDIFKKFP